MLGWAGLDGLLSGCWKRYEEEGGMRLLTYDIKHEVIFTTLQSQP